MDLKLIINRHINYFLSSILIITIFIFIIIIIIIRFILCFLTLIFRQKIHLILIRDLFSL